MVIFGVGSWSTTGCCKLCARTICGSPNQMGNSLNSTHLGSPRPSRSTSTQLRKLLSVPRRCSLPGRPTNPAMAPNRRTLGLVHIITSREQTLTDLPLWGGWRECEVSQSCLTWLRSSSWQSNHSKRMTYQLFIDTIETVKVFIPNAYPNIHII